MRPARARLRLYSADAEVLEGSCSYTPAHCSVAHSRLNKLLWVYSEKQEQAREKEKRWDTAAAAAASAHPARIIKTNKLASRALAASSVNERELAD